jgi:hypothetical protein
MNRRRFLEGLGLAVLAVQVLPSTSAHAENAPVIENDNLVIESGISRFLPASDHWHYLTVPLADLQNPPAQGVQLKTSRAYLHTHTVVLSAEQLTAIAQGQTVTVDDTVGDHQYALSLPKN